MCGSAEKEKKRRIHNRTLFIQCIDMKHKYNVNTGNSLLCLLLKTGVNVVASANRSKFQV